MGYSIITTVTAPASSRWLTTLDTVKDDLQITSTADDAYLGRLIARASSAIESYCHRIFAQTGRTDTFRWHRSDMDCGSIFGADGTGRAHPLVLSACPIVSVDSVVIDGVTLDPATDYEVEAGSGLLYHLGSTGLRQPWRFLVGTIAHTAGWVTPVDSPPEDAPVRTLPDDVESAALEWIKLGYAARKRDASIKLELIFDVRRVEYFDPPSSGDAELPANVRALLIDYYLPPTA